MAYQAYSPGSKNRSLGNYRVSPTKEFWETFPINLSQPATSLVNPSAIRKLALETGFPDSDLLNKICKDLTHGADMGCVGSARNHSFSTNAPSAYEFAPHVSDAIADWINKGFAYGPVPLELIPKNAKINGIMTKPKPNGSVRIILNLSSPIGNCVNEGIDTDNFPTVMSSNLNGSELFIWLVMELKSARLTGQMRINI